MFWFMQWMNPYDAAKNVDFEEQNEWTLAIQLEVSSFETDACYYILKVAGLDAIIVYGRIWYFEVADCL